MRFCMRACACMCVLLQGAEKVTLGGHLKEMNRSRARVGGKAFQVEVHHGRGFAGFEGQQAGQCAQSVMREELRSGKYEGTDG